MVEFVIEYEVDNADVPDVQQKLTEAVRDASDVVAVGNPTNTFIEKQKYIENLSLKKLEAIDLSNNTITVNSSLNFIND